MSAKKEIQEREVRKGLSIGQHYHWDYDDNYTRIIPDRWPHQTMRDGAHSHYFVMRDGTILVSDRSGEHSHTIETPGSAYSQPAAPHTHVVTLPSGKTIMTGPSSDHYHEHLGEGELAGVTGAHGHSLQADDDEALTSIGPAGKATVDALYATGVSTVYAETTSNPLVPYPSVVMEVEKRDLAIEFPQFCSVCKSEVADMNLRVEPYVEWLPACSGCLDNVGEKTATKMGTEDVTVEVTKADVEEQLVTGIVYEPEVADAHGEYASADVIKEGAHQFMVDYRRKTVIGLSHRKYFDVGAELVENYVTQNRTTIGSKTVKKGTWIQTWKVTSDDLWADVKEGVYDGFSFKGKVLVRKKNPNP